MPSLHAQPGSVADQLASLGFNKNDHLFDDDTNHVGSGGKPHAASAPKGNSPMKAMNMPPPPPTAPSDTGSQPMTKEEGKAIREQLRAMRDKENTLAQVLGNVEQQLQKQMRDLEARVKQSMDDLEGRLNKAMKHAQDAHPKPSPGAGIHPHNPGHALAPHKIPPAINGQFKGISGSVVRSGSEVFEKVNVNSNRKFSFGWRFPSPPVVLISLSTRCESSTHYNGYHLIGHGGGEGSVTNEDFTVHFHLENHHKMILYWIAVYTS